MAHMYNWGVSSSWAELMERRKKEVEYELADVARAMEELILDERRKAGQYETNEWGEVCP